MIFRYVTGIRARDTIKHDINAPLEKRRSAALRHKIQLIKSEIN